ncbi:MAG TPA: histidinol-phosphate transaminase [Candidatus Acidoferrales bacterium]|nr:histidinol-phosphate transaminase [Candidatus Acidoferrales bacterium]
MTYTTHKNKLTLAPCVHGGTLVEVQETFGNVLDFSANFNPLSFPNLEGLLSYSLSSVNVYPDNKYRRFREAVANHLNVDPNIVVPGNGSVELIRNVTSAILSSGDKVVIPAPTFDEYEYACVLCGAEITPLPIWNIDSFINELEVVLSEENIKMVFLCNPNNPTGRLLKRNQISKIADACSEKGTVLFVDEVFIELSDPSQSAVFVDYDNIFVLRSLTKSFSIPGLRVGYGLAPRSLSSTLNCLRVPWNLNSIAATVTPYLLSDCENYLETSRSFIMRERLWLKEKLCEISGIRPLKSEANFIMVDSSATGLSSAELAEKMLTHGFLIRDCSSFKLTDNNYIRLAVRLRDENQRLLSNLEKITTKE